MTMIAIYHDDTCLDNHLEYILKLCLCADLNIMEMLFALQEFPYSNNNHFAYLICFLIQWEVKEKVYQCKTENRELTQRIQLIMPPKVSQ